MLQKIILKNFQSHPKTELEFHPGVNAIIGTSDSGKTAVLRALNWVLTNRPTGDSFISHWAKGENGNLKPKEECSVKVYIDLDHWVERSKDRIEEDFNGYRTNNNSVYKAVGMEDPPEEIAKLFNIGEVNIQKQLDSPFLVSETSGETARYLNRIVKLDMIDKTLMVADRRKREIRESIKNLEVRITEIEKDLKKYGWVDNVEIVLEKVEKIIGRISMFTNNTVQLKNTLENYNKLQIVLSSNQKIISIEPLIDDVKNSMDHIETENNRIQDLTNTRNKHNEMVSKIQSCNKILEQEEKVMACIEISKNIEELKRKQDIFVYSLENHGEIQKKIPIIDKNIKELESEMPGICPLCGNPIKQEMK